MKKQILTGSVAALVIGSNVPAARADFSMPTFASDLGTAATSALTSVGTIVGPILLGALTLAVGMLVYRWVKKGVNK